MKSPRSLFLVFAASILIGFVAVSSVARGASTKPPVAAGKAGSTNTNTVVTNTILPIPSSVFDASATPTKNPFFPNSLRKPVNPSATNAPAGLSQSSFQLMSLGGSPDSRLAMINHRTFGAGEAVEVMTSSGQKVTIRVLQIKDTSVIVRIVNPPQPDLIELTLSKRAQ